MTNSEKIRRKALSLGFDLCGIACCRSLERQYDRFKNWLADGCDGGLEYLRRNTGKRFDPGALCEGARSVIVCGVGYHRPPSAHEVASRIASYAHSRDYHLTIRERLNELSAYLRELVPGASGRVFTDTAPLAEKSWAVEAGLGWIGRNSLLANPRLGSFLLLGEVVTTAELEPDAPFVRDGCGTCRACVDACPVAAIRPGRSTRGAAFPAGRSKPATGTKAICTAGCSGATYAKGPVLTTAKPRSPYTTLSHRLQNWNGWTSTTGWDWTRPVSGGFSAKHRLPGAVCAAYKSGYAG